MNAVPVEVSSRSAGRSKYIHHMAKRVSRPPAMIPTSSAVSPPSLVAVWMASDAARTDSPSTMIVNSPYRSAMWPRCHGVRPADSAHTGTRSSAAAPRGATASHQPGGRTRAVTHPIWQTVTPVAKVEGSGEPGREDERPDHGYEHRQAIDHVVAVVGRGEPGEVHPCPPQGEERHDEPKDRGGHLAPDQGAVEALHRAGHSHDEHQVEEELEGRGRPLRLGGVPGGHGAGQPQAAGASQAALAHWGSLPATVPGVGSSPPRARPAGGDARPIWPRPGGPAPARGRPRSAGSAGRAGVRRCPLARGARPAEIRRDGSKACSR